MEVCSEFIISLLSHTKLTHLDLSNNSLQYLPQNIQEAKHLTKIWLSGNPFVCDCSMLWMIDWIANFTLSSKEHVVQNYRNITCINTLMEESPIYKLNRVHMGCFPDRMPSWEIALLSVSGILLIAIVVIILIMFKKWEEIKFRLNIIDRNRVEDITGKKSDALLSYRYSYRKTNSNSKANPWLLITELNELNEFNECYKIH